MTSSVLWEDTLRKLAQSGVKQFVEAGPGEVLCGLVKRTLENVTIVAAGEPEKLSETLALLGRRAEPEVAPLPAEETPADHQMLSEES
jgi:malonyl CoA-acyl carrier protein transacylase